MKKFNCNICGKEIRAEKLIPLQIAYNEPNVQLFMTLNTYCAECNEEIVRPTLCEISNKLALNFVKKAGRDND